MSFSGFLGRVGLVGLLAFVLVGCGAEEALPPQPVVVRTVAAQPAVAAAASYTGVARAAVESRLSFQVGGVVSQVAVDVGDRVGRGTLVAQIDPSDFMLQQQQAQAGLQQAEAQARLAEAEYGRTRALYAEGVAPLSQYDNAKARAETARSAVAAATDQVALAERLLSYTRITAPVSGAVAQTLVEAGELVGPGQPVALVTTQGSPMEVTMVVPERTVAHINEGDAAQVQLSAFPNETFEAVVSEVGVAPGRSATTFPVTVRLRTADPRLRSGMAARVVLRPASDLPTGTSLVLPINAVNADGLSNYVMVVELPADAAETPVSTAAAADVATVRQATVRRRTVETGALTEAGLEILDGLRPGEIVVATGLGELSDGETVRLLPFDPLAADLRPFDHR